jgi:hypothetical protein
MRYDEGQGRVEDALLMLDDPRSIGLRLFALYSPNERNQAQPRPNASQKHALPKALQEQSQLPRPNAKTTTAKVRLRVASRRRQVKVPKMKLVTLKE